MEEKRKSRNRRVVVYDIATGERTEYQSVTMAAGAVGCNISWLNQVLKSRMHVNGFIVAYIEDEAKAIEKLRNNQSRGEFKRTVRRTTAPKGTVPLRIDDRTVIYVSPDQASESFAEKYRKKLQGDKPRRGGWS